MRQSLRLWNREEEAQSRFRAAPAMTDRIYAELRDTIENHPDQCWWRDPAPRLIERLEANKAIHDEDVLRYRAAEHAAKPQPPPQLLSVQQRGYKRVAVLDQLEVQLMRDALEQTLGHQAEAAKLLGISARVMHYRMQKFGFRSRRAKT